MYRPNCLKNFTAIRKSLFVLAVTIISFMTAAATQSIWSGGNWVTIIAPCSEIVYLQFGFTIIYGRKIIFCYGFSHVTADRLNFRINTCYSDCVNRLASQRTIVANDYVFDAVIFESLLYPCIPFVVIGIIRLLYFPFYAQAAIQIYVICLQNISLSIAYLQMKF